MFLGLTSFVPQRIEINLCLFKYVLPLRMKLLSVCLLKLLRFVFLLNFSEVVPKSIGYFRGDFVEHLLNHAAFLISTIYVQFSGRAKNINGFIEEFYLLNYITTLLSYFYFDMAVIYSNLIINYGT